MPTLTLGTHNVHDDAANVTAFADVILFTESPTSLAGRRAMRARLPGYAVRVCRRQRSLVIAYRKSGPFKPRRVKSGRYLRAHTGRKGVTPGRGTYEILGTLYDRPAVVAVEHRINRSYAAERGGYRRQMWRKHKRRTARFVRRQRKLGRLVLVGGDTNCAPRNSSKFAHLAYRGLALTEVGRRLDRLGVDRRLTTGDAQYLTRHGSDHPRLRVEVTVHPRKD